MATLCGPKPRVILHPPGTKTILPQDQPLSSALDPNRSIQQGPSVRLSRGGRAGRRADAQRGCRGSEGPRPCRPPFLPPPWPGTPGIWAAGARPPPALCSRWPVAPGPGPPLRSPIPSIPGSLQSPFPLFIFLGGVCVCGGLGRLGLCVWCGTGALGPFLSDAGGMQLIQWAAV